MWGSNLFFFNFLKKKLIVIIVDIHLLFIDHTKDIDVESNGENSFNQDSQCRFQRMGGYWGRASMWVYLYDDGGGDDGEGVGILVLYQYLIHVYFSFPPYFIFMIAK